MTTPPSEITTENEETTPAQFREAVESMHRAYTRAEISVGTIKPPQRLAPYSHAIGLEVQRPAGPPVPISEHTDGDAFGRLILLHDPHGDESWEGAFRLVAYIQADVEDALATDPLLPDVTWEWLNEGLDNAEADYSNVGGTVTATTSVRFGGLGGPPRAHQLELRASWTAATNDLSRHVTAFSEVLAAVAGLPPEGVALLPGA